MAVLQRPRQHAKQARVLRVVVGANSEKLAELRQHFPGLGLQHGTVTGRSGVAASAAVAVCEEPLLRVRAGWRNARLRGLGEQRRHWPSVLRSSNQTDGRKISSLPSGVLRKV